MNEDMLLEKLLQTHQELGAAYADLENVNRELTDAKRALTELRRELVAKSAKNAIDINCNAAQVKELLYILLNIFELNPTKLELIKIYKRLSGDDLRTSKLLVDKCKLWKLVEERNP